MSEIPDIVDFSVTTHYVINLPLSPADYYELKAEALIYDPDGSVDLDTVMNLKALP